MFIVKNKMINCYYLENCKTHMKTIVETLRKR